MNFNILVNTIRETHTSLQPSALKSVNKHLTIRNWLVGFYIVEFEQNGEDRAKYGGKLLSALKKATNIKGLSETSLKLNRQFYSTYPQISQILPEPLKLLGFDSSSIRQSSTAQLQTPISNDLLVPADKLISRLSFTHLVQLLPINDSLKRTF